MSQIDSEFASQDELEEYARLGEQIAALQTRRAALEDRAFARARAAIRELMAQHNLTLADLEKRGLPGAGIAKYRDPASGKTWSGFGTVPRWIRGRNRDEFLIAAGH